MYQKTKKEKTFITTSIFLSLLLLIFNPIRNFEKTSFADRIIGQGTLMGVDISKSINSFYILLIVLIPLAAILIYKILNKFIKNIDNKSLKLINVISTLGIIDVFLSFINNINNSKVLMVSTLILAGIDILVFIMIGITSLSSKSSKRIDFKWPFLAAIPFAFFGTYILHIIKFTIISSIVSFIGLYFIAVIILHIICNLKIINSEMLKKAYMFFLVSPILESIFLELYNILNQYNIIVTKKALIIVSIYAICFITTVIYYILNSKKNIKFNYKKYYYPIILIIFTFIMGSMQMTKQIEDTEFFETANSGLGIYEFIKYGKIPLIETYDAHMLSNEFFGILFGVINQDAKAALFNSYSIYGVGIVYIITYCFLKKIFSKDTAFLITIFLPMRFDLKFELFYMSLLPIITLINAYRKRTYSSFLVYWISIAFLCIWRLDLGFSISISTVLVLAYLWFYNRKNIKLKNILLSLITVIGVCLAFFITICVIKQINPITRIVEFLKLGMSNENWGYIAKGDPSKIAYAFCYYAMPLIVIGTLIYTIYKSKGKFNNLNIILMSLGIFYIVNLQRGLLRHSLVEGFTEFILSVSVLYLSIFVMKETKLSIKVFLFTYIGLTILNKLLVTPSVTTYSNLVDDTVRKYTEFTIQDERFREKTSRLEISQKITDKYKDLEEVINGVLDEDETYLDVTNQNLLYALIDREKPVYVNQSPGLLSGERTQQIYIEEVENFKKDIPIVLKTIEGTNIDGIFSDYRYYLLTEYIYNNYTPVAILKDYEIWFKNDELNEKLERLKQIKNDNIKIIGKDEYIKQNNKKIEIWNIPLIWGEYDVKKDTEKLQKNLGTNKSVSVNLNEIDKKNGNYIKLKLNSKINTKVQLQLMNKEQEISEYEFNVKEGIGEYIIRISTLYAWHEDYIDKINLNEEEVDVENISILEADTIKN